MMMRHTSAPDLQTLSTSSRPTGRRRGRERRGMAIIIVLGLLAVGLALSLSLLSSQTSTVQVQRNSIRSSSARQAAVAGLTAAIRRMHESDQWEGVGTTYGGRVSDTDTYSVTFTTGDASLGEDDEDYDLWPYRVTVLSTGYSIDSNYPNSPSTYRVQAVLQLVPKAVSSEPDDWDLVQQYRVFQVGRGAFSLELPCRVEGPTWVQGDLTLASEYPSYNQARVRYLQDLNAMQAVGREDTRPLDQNPTSRKTSHSSDTNSRLGYLGLGLAGGASKSVSRWSNPANEGTYQLYPGGEQYKLQQVQSYVQNTVLEPDPRTNPLGLFYRASDVTLGDNLRIRGTLISAADVRVQGQDVEILPADLPTVEGASDPIRLPTVIAADDIRFQDSMSATLRGIFVAWDEFRVEPGAKSSSLDLRGHVICEDFAVDSRHEWKLNYIAWWFSYSLFEDQEEEEHGIQYYPDYMRLALLPPEPNITFRQSEDQAQYHWLQSGQPLYVPHTDAEGLDWDLLQWTEEPAASD